VLGAHQHVHRPLAALALLEQGHQV
jgi:hypothetical protein